METRTLLSLLRQGGPVMWPLFALLAITLAIVAERIAMISHLHVTKRRVSKATLERPLAILDFIAMLSPVLGFLGTVTGMILAFKSVSQATSVQLQVVAAGLYEALFTTAFGLIISVLATVCSFILDLAGEPLCEEHETP